MEPVTHILTGAALARTGLNRRAAYATLAMAIAAQLPDIDTLWGLRGPVEAFTHHRGITHTFLGVPFEAAAVVGGCYLLHTFRLSRAKRAELAGKTGSKPLTKAPLAWGWLYLFCVLALLSHILLDYTNNYGVRPFFPFNPRWYAGSFVFIFDPLLFAFLLLPVVMPALFALVASEVGSRRKPFRGQAWAIGALTLVVCLWSLRAVEHGRAVAIASSQTLVPPPPVDDAGGANESPQTPLQPVEVIASPDPFNPFRWHIATDFGDFYQLATANVRDQTLTPTQTRYAKPARTAALIAAEKSALGCAFMDWSPMPFVSVSEPGDPGRVTTPEDTSRTAVDTVVTFRDPRFMGDVPLMRSARAPLTAVVELDPQNRVVRQTMDGRTER